MLYILSMIFQFMIIGFAVPTLMNVFGASDKIVKIMKAATIVKVDGTETV